MGACHRRVAMAGLFMPQHFLDGAFCCELPHALKGWTVSNVGTSRDGFLADFDNGPSLYFLPPRSPPSR
jgi:hypothetical protein